MRRQPAPYCPYPRDYARPTCYSCFRPESHCLCNLVTPFEAHTNILILQHPNEWRKYYSTTKLVGRAITNSKVCKGFLFSAEAIQSLARDQQLYLLYPSKNSADCEQIKLDHSNTVIALDGTWIEARKLLFHNPYLKTLPAISFKRPLRSNYRIRKQPREHCLSTLESIAHLLKLNAAAFGLEQKIAYYETLFQGFDTMVERQLQYWPRELQQEVNKQDRELL